MSRPLKRSMRATLAARDRRQPTSGHSRRERRAKQPEPVRAQDRVEPLTVVSAVSKRADERRIVLGPCEALECQALLAARHGGGVRRDDRVALYRGRLIDDVGPEPD